MVGQSGDHLHHCERSRRALGRSARENVFPPHSQLREAGQVKPRVTPETGSCPLNTTQFLRNR